MARTVYQYEAVDRQGRFIRNQLEAASPEEAVKDLTRKELYPVQLTVKQASGASTLRRFLPQSAPSKRDFALALKQFALLLRAGLPLIQATDNLKRQSVHPALLDKFEKIAVSLRAGETFSSSFAAVFDQLPAYVHRMAEAGEATGRLADTLDDASQQLEYEVKIAQSTRNALVYPSILVVAGISAIVFIFIVVVPRFAEMVARSETELPLVSKVVFGLGALFNENLWVFVIGAAALFAFILAGFRNKRVRQVVKNTCAKLPVMGPWLIEAEVARWAMLMSAMLRNGIELLRSLSLAEAAVTLSDMRSQLQQVEKEVRGGASLSSSLEEQNALPAVALSLVEVGEEAGELPDMLNSVAELYEESGRQRMARVLALIEPASILFLGLAVGTIVTAVMLALTSMNQISF